jgi:hypothetical protein
MSRDLTLTIIVLGMRDGMPHSEKVPLHLGWFDRIDKVALMNTARGGPIGVINVRAWRAKQREGEATR